MKRNRSKAADLIAKGIDVREADYAAPEALQKAFAGVDKLLLISGSEIGLRISQHQNVIGAAKKSNVKKIVYTSVLKADVSRMQLAVEHLATEKAIFASGIPFIILRNGWYIENYLGQIEAYLQHGVVPGSAKNGKVSAATRSDYAEAATAALIGTAAVNSIYELGGEAFTLSGLVNAVSEVSGKKVSYLDLPAPDYAKMLVSVGVPDPMAHILADSDLGILRGDLFTDRQDLANLIGHPTMSLLEAIRLTLKK